MFIDYYALLEINETASFQDIKEAFRLQALKWHPDRNIGTDTTLRMQKINEAYIILKDLEARARYDIEYKRFKQYKANSNDRPQHEKKYEESNQSDYKEKNKEQSEKTYEYYDFNINDDVLNNWMNNAKNQAVDLAKQTIEDFIGMAAEGLKGATTGCFGQFIVQIGLGVLFTLFFFLFRACNN